MNGSGINVSYMGLVARCQFAQSNLLRLPVPVICLGGWQTLVMLENMLRMTQAAR
jgi:hypothetical protein